MYIRIKKVKNKNGKVYEYEQLVESYKVRGKTKQKVLMTLGKKGEVDPSMIEKIISTLVKKNPTLELVRQFDQKTPDLKIHWSKEFGCYFVFRKIWEKLGLQSAMEVVAPKQQDPKEFAEMMYLLTLSRILDPGSERRVATTFEPKIHHRLNHVPKLNEYYKAIAHLQKKRGTVEKVIYDQVKGLFKCRNETFSFFRCCMLLYGI